MIIIGIILLVLAVGCIGLFIQYLDSITRWGIVDFLRDGYYMVCTISVLLMVVVLLLGLFD